MRPGGRTSSFPTRSRSSSGNEACTACMSASPTSAAWPRHSSSWKDEIMASEHPLGPVMIDVAGQELAAEERETLAHPLVGGIILFARNYASPDQLRALTAAIHAIRTPPLLIAADQEGGRVQRFIAGFTRLPPMRALGTIHDRDPKLAQNVAQALGVVLGAEIAAHGVDFSF